MSVLLTLSAARRRAEEVQQKQAIMGIARWEHFLVCRWDAKTALSQTLAETETKAFESQLMAVVVPRADCVLVWASFDGKVSGVNRLSHCSVCYRSLGFRHSSEQVVLERR